MRIVLAPVVSSSVLFGSIIFGGDRSLTGRQTYFCHGCSCKLHSRQSPESRESSSMDPASHLKYLLQTQLATDSSAVRYLPYCLSTLTVECLLPSAHLAKWTTRILALFHSKDAGARWAGLCLAHKSSILSQKIMIDCAQSWITVVLPMLSVGAFVYGFFKVV